jgi:hypothetical protein
LAKPNQQIRTKKECAEHRSWAKSQAEKGGEEPGHCKKFTTIVGVVIFDF